MKSPLFSHNLYYTLKLFVLFMFLRTLPVRARAAGIFNASSVSTMSKELDFSKQFSKIDELRPKYFERLGKALEIPAVSGDASLRENLFKKADFLVSEMEKLGFTDIQKRDLGLQKPSDIPNLCLPPVILGRYGNDPQKKTVLAYAHYDVQPASKEDGWDTEPFEFYVDEAKQLMRARGVTDDTGPLTGWLNVVEAYKELGMEFPVNLLVCFEGMEESGSEGLEELIEKEATEYFKDVNSVCISDNYWLGTTKPTLTYGLRGVQYYQATIHGPAADLHSGIFGGAVAEPMTDLVKIFDSLVDVSGKILIDGVNEMVAPVTEEEHALYEKIDFSVEDMNASTGSNSSLYTDKIDTLMHRWRFPSLSIHGIEGAFSGAGSKTVIPAKVAGKFSIRTVPDMDLDKLAKLVSDHCKKVFKSLGSPNTLKFDVVNSGNYWLSNPKNKSFSAASKAIQTVYNVEPDFTREGGSIPITLFFEEKLKTEVMLMPMGRGDDGAHSVNEKLDISNYFGGMKSMAAFLEYFAADE